MLRLKQCIKMFLIVFDVLVKLGILQNIVAREIRKDFHSAEFVTKIDAKKNILLCLPFKKYLAFVIEGLFGRIPGGTEHELLALKHAATTILLAGVFASASVIRNHLLRKQAGIEYFISILLVDPRRTHPCLLYTSDAADDLTRVD